MSYCRWSSCNFACDIYCYADVSGGYTIHVAGRRRVGPEPRPDFSKAMAAFMRKEITSEEVVKVNQDLMAWCEKAELHPIGLPHDGETLNLPTAEAAADKLEELRALGYMVPQSAIDALREDARDEDERA